MRKKALRYQFTLLKCNATNPSYWQQLVASGDKLSDAWDELYRNTFRDQEVSLFDTKKGIFLGKNREECKLFIEKVLGIHCAE